jgi:hypothetical protein
MIGKNAAVVEQCVKEMKKRLKDEEYQSKSRNAGNRSAR